MIVVYEILKLNLNIQKKASAILLNILETIELSSLAWKLKL